MHFKLSIVANIGLWVYKLMFVSFGVLQFDHDLVLLARMVDHFTHHFLLPLNQLLARIDVRFDEFFPNSTNRNSH